MSKKKKPERSEVNKVLDRVRAVIGDSTCDERELYEALMAEAEGWKMRLEELEDDEETLH